MQAFEQNIEIHFRQTDMAGIAYFNEVFNIFHDTYEAWVAKNFENKKKMKTKSNLVDFCSITEKNVLQVRVINELAFPISYSDKFYTELAVPRTPPRARAITVAETIVGAVSFRLEPTLPDSERKGSRMYIMTLSVLEAYRRIGLGSLLLDFALEQCRANVEIVEIYLHVHTENPDAIEFYKKRGFDVDPERVANYYSKLDKPDAFLVSKKIFHEVD